MGSVWVGWVGLVSAPSEKCLRTDNKSLLFMIRFPLQANEPKTVCFEKAKDLQDFSGFICT